MRFFEAFLLATAATVTARKRTGTGRKPTGEFWEKVASNIDMKFQSGTLKGLRTGSVDAYLNIRVKAKAPVGPLRFASPQKPAPLTGNRDAANLGSRCLQVIDQFTTGENSSEDCLQLNLKVQQKVQKQSYQSLFMSMVGHSTELNTTLPHLSPRI
jgi:hypothetical protein